MKQQIKNQILHTPQICSLKGETTKALKFGISILSCTKDSPLNEFLEFKDLEIAIKESEEKVKAEKAPILHSEEAERLYLVTA